MNIALGGRLFLEDEPQKTRLPRTGSADEKDELPLEYLEADAIERRTRSTGVGLGDGIKANHDGDSLGRQFGIPVSDTPTPSFLSFMHRAAD